MSVNGRIITGFSNPRFSVLGETTRTCMPIARGVDVTITPTFGDDIIFYADNGVAETCTGSFKNGTVTLNVDGMHATVEDILLGHTAPTQPETWEAMKTTDTIPYVAVGFVCRFVSEGTTSYVPVILPKCKFKNPNTSAKTQGENLEFQQQALEATFYENADHIWKLVDTATYSDEAAAVTALETKIITV